MAEPDQGIEDASGADQPDVLKMTKSGKRLPSAIQKLLVVAVAIAVVAGSAGAIWYVFFRHWSVADLAEQVIFDPDISAPGYKHSLAGDEVIVEGVVTDITTHNTTLGELNAVELDGLAGMELVYWGPVGFEVGDRIERKVTFEWSQCNDERHVYSPEIAFPTIVPLFGITVVQAAVYYTNTHGGTCEVSNQGEDVKTSITWFGEPVPLEQINCTLKSGRASYTREYIDVLGSFEQNNVSDRIDRLSDSMGQNGTIEFVDANSDSYLDNGDFFLLKNLSRPSMTSGLMTHMLVIDWPLEPDSIYGNGPTLGFYYQMTSRGVLYPILADSPAARVFMSDDDDAKKCTFDWVGGPLAWDDIIIQVTDGTNYVTWEPAAANFSEGPTHMLELPSQMLGTIEVGVVCADLAGDRLVQEGDFFVVAPEDVGGFPEDQDFEALVLSEETHERMGFGMWFSETATPESTLTSVRTAEAQRLTFSTVHNGTDNSFRYFPVPWDELAIVLDDGGNESTLCPPSGFLHENSGSTRLVGEFLLGAVPFTCNATDLNGDGYVNAGDCITIVPSGPMGFSPSLSYTCSIIYAPESSLMASVAFAG